jgi:serine phosphatase RsbU (regulator of sigma subunit)
MKVRTKLVLACFLLSILPLAGIVLYSYQSSRKALESAYHNEAARMTRQMDHRLAAIRGDLEQRLAEVSALPLQSLPNGAPANERLVVSDVLRTLGESARLVDSLELQPLAAPPPQQPSQPTRVIVRHGTPAPAAHATPQIASASHHASHDDNENDDSNDDEPSQPEPIIIDIPSVPMIPRISMTAEQRSRMREITRISAKLAAEAGGMPPSERDALVQQVVVLQKQANDDNKAAQAEFHQQLEEAIRLRNQRRAETDARHQEQLAARIARQQEKLAPLSAMPPVPPANEVAVTTPTPPATVSAQAPAASAATAPTAPAAQIAAPEAAMVKQKLSAEEKARLHEYQKRVALLFGRNLNVPVTQQGSVVGHLSAQIKPDEVIRRVLGAPGEDGELPFAADRDGNVYTRTQKDRQTLDELGITKAMARGVALPHLDNWIVVLSQDRASGLRVGVARPVGDDWQELRRTAAYNFSAGIALIFIALIGIVPVANHITRDVKLVTAGAERIAQGDLMTRLPVRSADEFGQLAAAFNQMAHDLSHQQQTIVEQVRVRKEQELQQRMLELEYGRKSMELEEARRFQLSMLPRFLPEHDRLEVAVFTQTATEVGGDYYDFHAMTNGVLSSAVGDATGHGAKAGTMVTVVKTLFASYDGSVAPSEFLRDSAEKIKRMELGRMAMSLLLARFAPSDRGVQVTFSAAGMPPALVHRALDGSVEEMAMAATPLGTLGSDYHDRSLELNAGDTILFLTDGLPELLDASGQQFGYPATLDAFRLAAAAPSAERVIATLAQAAQQWHGDQAPNDDMTFVVFRVRS